MSKMYKRMIPNLLILFVLSLVLFSFSMTATAQAKKANWWDKFGKPKYGGTITYRTRAKTLSVNFDNTIWFWNDYNYWWETMFVRVNWTMDRDKWGFKVPFTPEDYCKGLLAETWELPDMRTIVVKIRKGVHFQDKPPVNGRELTAYDVQKHYDRILGTGSGYTSPLPMYGMFTANFDRVTAADKYTVVYKFKKPSAFNLLSIIDPLSLNAIEAPEWVALGGPPQNKPPAPPPGPDKGEGDKGGKGGPPPIPKGGPLSEWRNAVGTGPWILTDYKDATSMTFTRNPNYWGRDERFPQNQVPYADTLKLTNIPDTSTALAALRTGKLDVMEDMDWRQKKTMSRSKPDIQFGEIPGRGTGVQFRCDTKPFTDIRVRKALQMAIDRPVMAKSLYGGTVDGTPVGAINPALKGYAFEYKDWPRKLKDEYKYNPKAAKKLLAEAGYPKGFKTNTVYGIREDQEVIEAIKAYFMEIGVDMEIRTMEYTHFGEFVSSGKHDQMNVQDAAYPVPPSRTIGLFDSRSPENSTYNNDPKYDALVDKFWSATSSAKVAGFTRDMDRMFIENHWQVTTFATVTYTGWQNWLKGYSGETHLDWAGGYLWSRLWVDESLK